MTVVMLQPPKRMRTLEKDKRGYPIPFVVMRDTTGGPQFTVNDTGREIECVRKGLCGICGKRLDDGFWFVGGSRCFLGMYSYFVDPPNHQECATYALQVCPFLAARSYSNRIELKKLPPGGQPKDSIFLSIPEEMMGSEQPKWFGLGQTMECEKSGPMHDDPFFVKSWKHVEWWDSGAPLPVAPPELFMEYGVM